MNRELIHKIARQLTAVGAKDGELMVDVYDANDNLEERGIPVRFDPTMNPLKDSDRLVKVLSPLMKTVESK